MLARDAPWARCNPDQEIHLVLGQWKVGCALEEQVGQDREHRIRSGTEYGRAVLPSVRCETYTVELKEGSA